MRGGRGKQFDLLLLGFSEGCSFARMQRKTESGEIKKKKKALFFHFILFFKFLE